MNTAILIDVLSLVGTVAVGIVWVVGAEIIWWRYRIGRVG